MQRMHHIAAHILLCIMYTERELEPGIINLQYLYLPGTTSWQLLSCWQAVCLQYFPLPFGTVPLAGSQPHTAENQNCALSRKVSWGVHSPSNHACSSLTMMWLTHICMDRGN